MSLLPHKKNDITVNPVSTLHDAVDELFDSFNAQFGGFENLTGRSWLLPWRAQNAEMTLRPRMDFEQNENGYMLTAEVPGMNPKDIDISFDGRMLMLKGEKHDSRSEERTNWFVNERSYGSWMRTMAMPDDADTDAITARYTNGLLEVSIPRNAAAAESVKKIEVKTD